MGKKGKSVTGGNHPLLMLAILFVNILTVSMAGAQTSGTIPANPQDISPLLYGEKIPAVTLKDVSGKTFDLSRAVSEKPVVLVFYRGGWCPYCTRQLSGLQEALPDLEKAGYSLIAVSTDQPENLQQSAEKSKLEYTLLSDADLSVSKLFGIAYKAPQGYHNMLKETTGGLDEDLLLPVPSVFVLDRKGVIRFEYINPDYTQRLDAVLLRSVLSALNTRQ